MSKFENKNVKSAGKSISLLAKLDERFKPIAESYGRLANKFENVVNALQFSDDLLDRAEITFGEISKLINRIEDINRGGDDYRFEFDLITSKILNPCQLALKNRIDCMAVEIKADFFAPLGEWHISITNLRNSSVFIEKLEVLINNNCLIVEVASGKELVARRSFNSTYYSDTITSKKQQVRAFLKELPEPFSVDVDELHQPTIFKNQIANFPKPLMKVYLKIWEEKSALGRYKKALDAFKQLLHYTAFALIGDALAYAGDGLRAEILQKFSMSSKRDGLATPSEGHWIQLVFALANESFPSIIPKLKKSVETQETQMLFNKLHELKKRDSHGAKKPDKDIPLKDCIRTLHDLYEKLQSLSEYPLVYSDGIYDGKNRISDAMKVMGLVPPEVKIHTESYILGLFISGENDKLIPMEPLLHVNDEDKENWDSLKFYNRRSRKKVFYVDYLTGEDREIESDFDAKIASIK